MFRNYFKIALRNFKRNKGYAAINTLGLAVGIAACLLIFLVVQFESSFDDFHPDKNNIYRVGTEFHNQDGVSYSAGVSFPVADALRAEFPQVKKAASILQQGGQITVEDGKTHQKKLQEDDFYYADSTFFSIFNFPFLAGNAKTALKDPNSVVLTETTAEKYFGLGPNNYRNAIGKTIKYENKYLYTVTGILKDIPHNSDFPLNAVVPYAALVNTDVKDNLNDWVSTYGQNYTFVELQPGVSVPNFNAKLRTFAKKHKPAEYAKDSYVLQPLTEIHYDERFGNYRGHTFSHSLITALSLIGIFLIIIACVNFINLATAQAVNRSKEVGVRKVLGSDRKQLGIQFLSETSVIVFAALLLAIAIASIALPFLNKLLDVQMTMSFIANPSLIIFIVAAGILVTLLSGIYPAIILSGFNPITALKSKITSKMIGGISLRRALVVLQFGIANILNHRNAYRRKPDEFFQECIVGL